MSRLEDTTSLLKVFSLINLLYTIHCRPERGTREQPGVLETLHTLFWVWADGWVDGWMDRRMDGWMDRWMMDGEMDDGWMDGWVDGWMMDGWVAEWIMAR